MSIALSDRLDASYDWLPAPPQKSKSLVDFGNGCSDPRPFNVAGEVPSFIDLHFMHSGPFHSLSLMIIILAEGC
jgi:hypothetical protein